MPSSSESMSLATMNKPRPWSDRRSGSASRSKLCKVEAFALVLDLGEQVAVGKAQRDLDVVGRCRCGGWRWWRPLRRRARRRRSPDARRSTGAGSRACDRGRAADARAEGERGNVGAAALPATSLAVVTLASHLTPVGSGMPLILWRPRREYRTLRPATPPDEARRSVPRARERRSGPRPCGPAGCLSQRCRRYRSSTTPTLEGVLEIRSSRYDLGTSSNRRVPSSVM